MRHSIEDHYDEAKQDTRMTGSPPFLLYFVCCLGFVAVSSVPEAYCAERFDKFWLWGILQFPATLCHFEFALRKLVGLI